MYTVGSSYEATDSRVARVFKANNHVNFVWFMYFGVSFKAVFLCCLARCVAAVETGGDGHCSGGLQGGAMLNEVGVVSVRPLSVS